AECIGDILLLNDRIDSEYVDRPSAADVRSEGLACLDRRIRQEEWHPGSWRHDARTPFQFRHMLHVLDQMLIQQRRLDHDRPCQRCGRRATFGTCMSAGGRNWGEKVITQTRYCRGRNTIHVNFAFSSMLFRANHMCQMMR